MIKSRTCMVDINKITVPYCVRKSLPKSDKIEKRYRCYKQIGAFDREIIVDEDYTLIDGYSTYLVCKMLDIQKVRILRIIVDDSEHVKELKTKLEESERMRSKAYQALSEHLGL
mgnify:CR=1 FL=1